MQYDNVIGIFVMNNAISDFTWHSDRIERSLVLPRTQRNQTLNHNLYRNIQIPIRNTKSEIIFIVLTGSNSCRSTIRRKVNSKFVIFAARAA